MPNSKHRLTVIGHRLSVNGYLYPMFRVFQLLYVLYAFLMFVALMIPVFVWSLFAVMAGGRVRGGNLVYRACMVWGDIWYFLVFLRHRNIYEQPLSKNNSYIFVCNHTSYLDVPCIVKTFRYPVRPLGKAEMAKVPIFGFIYKTAIVTVDRSNPANRARSVQELKDVLAKGVSVLVFPEGTFNETDEPLKSFYDGAFRVAIETGAPIKPVLMLDNYNRMHYRSIFSLNPGRSRSIFLQEIPTSGYTLTDLPQLREKVFSIMSQKLVEYQASWIKV